MPEALLFARLVSMTQMQTEKVNLLKCQIFCFYISSRRCSLILTTAKVHMAEKCFVIKTIKKCGGFFDNRNQISCPFLFKRYFEFCLSCNTTAYCNTALEYSTLMY